MESIYRGMCRKCLLGTGAVPPSGTGSADAHRLGTTGAAAEPAGVAGGRPWGRVGLLPVHAGADPARTAVHRPGHRNFVADRLLPRGAGHGPGASLRRAHLIAVSSIQWPQAMNDSPRPRAVALHPGAAGDWLRCLG